MSDIVLYKMAAKLGMNPLQFMRKTFITEDPDEGNQDDPTMAMSSKGLRAALERAATEIGYEAKYHAPGAKTLPDGRLHGIGIHAHNDRHGTTSTGRGVLINMNADGTVYFNTGQSRVQDAASYLSAIIAETLGVDYNAVSCGVWGDPTTAPDGGSQAGSAGGTSNGSAAQMAALDVRTQLFTYAAGQLKVKAEELDAEGGKIFVKADPTKSMTHAQVMAKISKPIIGVGKSYANNLRRAVGKFPVGTKAWHRTGIATAYEVAVDPETGIVEVLNSVHVCDAGRVINKNAAAGQVNSSQPVQYGKSFLWELKHDPQTGVLLTQSFLDDKMATALDATYDHKAILLETINACGPFGMNGISEPAATSGYCALIDAINNATGLWLSERPLTPYRILKGLGKV